MKDSCTRVVLLFCSLMLLFANQSFGTETVVGPPFKFEFAETFIPEGEVGCVEVRVEGFDDVRAFQFGIAFDNTIFRFDGAQTTELNPIELLAGSAMNMAGEEIITIGFADFDGATTLPDGTVAFTLCFEALGSEGDLTSLVFTDLPNGEVSQLNDINGLFTAPDLCVVGIDVIIGNPPMMLTITPTTTPTTCQNSLDGQIEIGLSGGELPYSVFVTNCVSGDIILGPEPAGNTVIVNGLDPGEYCIEVTDNSMPSMTANATVMLANGGPSLGANFDIVEPSCNGRTDGSVEVFPILNAVQQSNSNGDFNFIWTGSSIMGQIVGPDLPNIGAGNYEVLITEVSSGCTVVQNVTVTQPAAIEVSIAVTNETCDAGGMDGTAAAVTTGGVGNFTFMWDDMNSSTDSLITGLGQGTYTVVVRDGNNCPATDTEDISAPLPPVIMGFDSTRISCAGEMDGSLTVLFDEGSASIDRVEWMLPGGVTQSGATIDNLGPGSYVVTVIAVDNCESDMTVLLGDAASLEIDLANTTVDVPECNDGATGALGSLNISVLGGTPPFTFNVNGEEFPFSPIGNRLPGVYDVFVGYCWGILF